MKVSLISTVCNEAFNMREYFYSVTQMSRLPDELVVVDGGSTDKTVKIIEELAAEAPFPVILIVEKGCNIAKGRNIAIKHASHELIAVTDAGCRVDREWLREITKPFADPSVDVVGGWFEPDSRTFFERAVENCSSTKLSKIDPEQFLPSSRSVAFTRKAWSSVGGYPEWLTLAAEDTLFDLNLKKKGMRFHFAKKAKVYWRPRANLKTLLRQYYFYGLGEGEARLFRHEYVKIIVKLLLLVLIVFLGVVWSSGFLLLLPIILLIAYQKNMKCQYILFVVPSLIVKILIDVWRTWGWMRGTLAKRSDATLHFE